MQCINAWEEDHLSFTPKSHVRLYDKGIWRNECTCGLGKNLWAGGQVGQSGSSPTMYSPTTTCAKDADGAAKVTLTFIKIWTPSWFHECLRKWINYLRDGRGEIGGVVAVRSRKHVAPVDQRPATLELPPARHPERFERPKKTSIKVQNNKVILIA